MQSNKIEPNPATEKEMITSEGIKCDVCGKWIILPVLGIGKMLSFIMKDPITSEVQGKFQGHDNCVELVKQACMTPGTWRAFPDGPLKEAYKEAQDNLDAKKENPC